MIFAVLHRFFASTSILILTMLWPKLLQDIAAVSTCISDLKSSEVLCSNIDEEVSWNTGDFCLFYLVFASKSVLILTMLWPKLLHYIAAVFTYISD